MTLVTCQPVGTGSAQIRWSIAPNRVDGASIVGLAARHYSQRKEGRPSTPLVDDCLKSLVDELTQRLAMQLTGHKTRAVFERYNIASAGHLRDAAQRLDRFMSDRTSQ